MKKVIPQIKVEDVAIAIVPRAQEESEIAESSSGEDDLWDVYLVNLKEDALNSVLITSKGYGALEGETRKTTVLRHFFERIGPLTCTQIEPIQTKLFRMTNEYWISFSLNDYMYDKKYVFVKGSIDEMNFTTIPLLKRKGVMIK